MIRLCVSICVMGAMLTMASWSVKARMSSAVGKVSEIVWMVVVGGWWWWCFFVVLEEDFRVMSVMVRWGVEVRAVRMVGPRFPEAWG